MTVRVMWWQACSQFFVYLRRYCSATWTKFVSHRQVVVQSLDHSFTASLKGTPRPAGQLLVEAYAAAFLLYVATGRTNVSVRQTRKEGWEALQPESGWIDSKLHN